MLTFNRIMLAGDTPASALAALRYAAPLARLTGARLQVLRVVDTRVAALSRWTDVFRSTEAFAELETANIDATQQLLRHPALAGLAVEEAVWHGHPTDRIIDAAAAQVDFVVVGLQGQGTAHAHTAAKMARQIAHACPVPVLLVQATASDAAQAPVTATSPLPIQNILLALQTGQYAPPAVTLAQELALACKAPLHVIQAFEPGKVDTYPFTAEGGLSRNAEGIKALLHDHLETIVPADSAGPSAEHVVVEGPAADVILGQAAARRADLVVMSAHAYEGLQRLFTLSTIDTVFDQLTCPLLAVPFPAAFAMAS